MIRKDVSLSSYSQSFDRLNTGEPEKMLAQRGAVTFDSNGDAVSRVQLSLDIGYRRVVVKLEKHQDQRYERINHDPGILAFQLLV